MTCQANGRHKKAAQILEDVVAAHPMALTKHHPQLISSSLALAYQANGQAAEATRLMLLNQVTAERHLSPLKTSEPIEASMLDTVTGMDNVACGTGRLDDASWLSTTHMRCTNETIHALNAESYEKKANTLLGKSVETLATYPTCTAAAPNTIPATLSAVGAIGTAITLAGKLFAVDIPQRKIAERLSESERDKAYAEMQKALESKMNVLSSELQNSLKLVEEMVAHTESDLERRSSTIVRIEAQWLEKNERLDQARSEATGQ